MQIVLDTNVLQQDFRLRSGRWRVIAEFAEKVNARFALPQIVLDETVANYRRALERRRAEVVRAAEELSGLLRTPWALPVLPDVEAEVASFTDGLLRGLSVRNADIVPYLHDHLTDAIGRAIARRRPCSDKGEEIRDAVLWSAVLHVAKERGGHVCFVSQNVRQFGQDAETLHSDLVAEAAALGVLVEYFPSLEAFARKHATPIAFIDAEWIESQLDADAELDAVHEPLIEQAQEAAYERAGFATEIEGGFRVESGGLSIGEYFVNDIGADTLRVEVIWYGSPEVSYEARENYERYRSRWSPHHEDYAPLVQLSVEVSVTVTTQLIVRDKKLVEWSVVDRSIR